MAGKSHDPEGEGIRPAVPVLRRASELRLLGTVDARGRRAGEARAQALAKRMRGRDATKPDAAAFLRGLPGTDMVILAGGDGTLNHFANALNGVAPSRTICCCPTGPGNDFMNDARENAANEDGKSIRRPAASFGLRRTEISGTAAKRRRGRPERRRGRC